MKSNKLPTIITRSTAAIQNHIEKYFECHFNGLSHLTNCFSIHILQDGKGNIHQVWYDDPESISLKASYVGQRRLRGIGMWNGNLLDYGNDPVARQQSAEMWNALIPKHAPSMTVSYEATTVSPNQ